MVLLRRARVGAYGFTATSKHSGAGANGFTATSKHSGAGANAFFQKMLPIDNKSIHFYFGG
ncbi:hypothetical protein [Psychrobacillus sp. OK032]|uniref:hypothetical protein n=1 Tax=Psychrobacillus sp. OK032 TaxID=1884358 RepID=UPI0008BF9155|nr:hypothetical protein [Psychrobacillus sp. OK032]SES11664.1 hypothetical protein SAMN05518872_104285 [Psychrobacillus sp. OK032]